jgi:DNA-binding PadR family transcriptional regulator
MRRGESRFLLLDILRDGPKHGYEIIKALEERSAGQYTPSPGTIYPTLQFAEEAGLARVTQEGDRRVYELTEAGKAELALHTEEIAAFWERFATVVGTTGQRVEMGFLEEEVEFLTRTLWNGLREAGADNTEILRRLRQSIERCRNEVRDILSTRSEES